jgi:GTP-binding protein EngB required for normal cell division
MSVEKPDHKDAASADRAAFAQIARVREACEAFRIVSLDRRLEAAESLKKETSLIDVAVLGQFKAGKSSFINSLVGEPVLPAGVVPVTTVICRLQYGPARKAEVTFFDGTRREVEPDRLDEYTSEAKNPSNQKNVEMVDIELPSLIEYPGLRIVDTPGLGSIFAYHRATAEHWLPEAGAALLAISADRPLAENDLKLIRELVQYTPNVALLLTKSDLLTGEQQDEVVTFFQESLKREFNRTFPVFLYSTRTGTEEYRRRLDAEVLFKLSVDRDFEFSRILRHKTRGLAASCLGYLDIALKTALQADSDKEQLRAQVLDEKVNFDLIREELFIISRENRKQTRELINRHLEQFQGPLTLKLKEELHREMAGWKFNLWRMTRSYEQWLADRMSEEMRSLSRQEHRHFYGTLKKAHASLSRSLQAFRTLLSANVEKVLGISLTEAEWNLAVDEPEHPDIKTTRAFDFHLDLIWFLIPMFIFRRFFERDFINKINREVETNLARLAAQWEDRINRTIEEMKRQAAGYVRDELATIEALLLPSQGKTQKIRDIISGIKSGLADLD